MAQVVGLKFSPRTPEPLTHQRPDITVAALGVEGRQSLGAQGPALGPLGRQRQRLACPGLAIGDAQQPKGLYLSEQQSLMGPAAIGSRHRHRPLPGG